MISPRLPPGCSLGCELLSVCGLSSAPRWRRSAARPPNALLRCSPRSPPRRRPRIRDTGVDVQGDTVPRLAGVELPLPHVGEGVADIRGDAIEREPARPGDPELRDRRRPP